MKKIVILISIVTVITGQINLEELIVIPSEKVQHTKIQTINPNQNSMSGAGAAIATITVDGYAYLENQTTHDSIRVLFERIAPSSLLDTTFTATDGYYTIQLETGIYNVEFNKDGHFTGRLTNQAFYADTTVVDTTLIVRTTLLNVPTIFSTIQSAIEEAIDGDTVLVQPGTYVENISNNSKNIVIGSLLLTTGDISYINQTIIDGNQDGRVVSLSNNAVLTGFSITNGFVSYPSMGAGISCGGSTTVKDVIISGNTTNHRGGGIAASGSTTIKNAIISGNTANSYGGGIHCNYGDSLTIENVTISGNTAGSDGGGIYSWRGNNSLTIKNSIISGNTASGFSSNGGGISCNQSSPTITNTIISGNTGYNGGGISIDASSPILNNVTISGNTASNSGGGIACSGSPTIINNIVNDNTGNYGIYVWSGNPSISYSNFSNNENGNFYNAGDYVGLNVTVNANGDSCDAYYNIQEDPLYVDINNNNYRLQNWSQLIGAGTTTSAPTTDIEGNPRPNPAGSNPDMGAFENKWGTPQNATPVITAMSDVTVNEDESYSDTLRATDEEGDAITYSASSDTSAVTASITDSILTLTPNANWHGVANIKAYASDGYSKDSTSFKLTVTPVDDISAVQDMTIDEDKSAEVTLTSTFSGTTTFTAVSDTNAVTTSVSSSALTLTPTANWHGVANIKAYASDGTSKDSTSFTLTVTSVNDAPTAFEWVSSALDTINITQSNLNDIYTLQWGASTDAADGDSITYLLYARTGVNPAEEVYDTTSTSLPIPYQEFLQKTFEQIPMLSRATVKFSVSATDGIDTVKVTGDDRVVFVNRYEYLSTADEGIPTEFALHDNYPNPFNPTTTFRFDVPEVSDVTLSIYNMLGQKVRTFNYQNTSAGYHSVKWNATNDYGDPVGAGVYLYQLRANQYVKTRKMVLLK